MSLAARLSEFVRRLILGEQERLESSFEDELQHIFSRISESVRSQDLFATERGLDLIEHLFMSEVEFRHSVAEWAPKDEGPAAGIRGSEHRLIVDEVHNLIDVSSGCDHRGVRDRTASFSTRMFRRMLEMRRYDEAASVSGLIGHLWRLIATREGAWSSDDQDTLLLRVRDVCAFSAPRSGTDKNTAHWTVVCALFAHMVVFAVRENLTDAVHEVLATFAEVRVGREGSPSDVEFRKLKDATLLAVVGWILLRVDTDERSAELIPLIGEALGDISYDDFWSVVEFILHEEEPFRSSLQASWWEMEGNFVRGRAGGAIRIDSFIQIAIVLAAAHRYVRLDSVPKGDASGTFQLLVNAVSALRGNPRFSALVVGLPYLEELEGILRRQVDEEERFKGEKLARQPLSSSRIRLFHDAFGLEYRDSRNLVDELALPLVGEVPDDVFGFKSRIKKWWFVDHTDVHADPGDLGRDLARSLRRGEEEALTEKIRSGDSMGEIDSQGSLVDSLAAWMRRSLGQSGEEGVIVTNSWRVMRELGGRDRRQSDSGLIAVRIAEFSCLLVRVYEPPEPFVAVVNRSNGVYVRWFAPRSAPSGSELIEGRVRVDVRSLSEQEVDSILSRDPDAHPEQEVVVSALEGLQVRDGEPGQAAWWTLGDDWD